MKYEASKSIVLVPVSKMSDRYCCNPSLCVTMGIQSTFEHHSLIFSLFALFCLTKIKGQELRKFPLLFIYWL